MTTVIIPKELNKEKNLIAVPRATYEEFLTWQKKIKSAKTFKPTAAVKRALSRARKNLTRGKYFTLAELEHELAARR